MFPQIVVKHSVGNTIQVPNQIDVRAFTYLGNNLSIGSILLPVDNAVDFTAGAIMLLLSSMGAENSEFVASSAHTDQTITVGATKQLHNRGDMVQQVRYDQIVIKKSATLDGSYSDLVTLTMQTTQQKTIAFDATGLISDFYKVQWKNSQTGEVSSLSDPISVLTYPEYSVAEIIFPVLKAMGVSENDPKITTEFCISAVDDARKFMDTKLFGIRQDWRAEFEYPIKVLAGTISVDLPDDIDFKFTDRSTLAARFLIGNVLTPFNLRYIDKRTWNQVAFQVTGSETTEETAISATEIQLENTGDFWDSAGGVAYVATDDYDQEIMEVEYTGRDLITNQLTGVTGVTRIIPAGTRVWSNPTVSQPIYYTVFENKLVFDRIIPDSMQGNNIYIDYYKKLPKVTDLYQELAENYRENYKFYLRYAIKYRKDITIDETDGDLVKFYDLAEAVYQNLYTGQDSVIVT